MKKIYVGKIKKEIDYKKRYRILYVETLAILFVLLFVVYSNFEYILFKILISENYIYTDTLDTIYEDRLDINSGNINYAKYFDKLAISLIAEQIYRTNGDIYTHMKTKEQYKAYKEYTDEKSGECELSDLGNGAVYLKIPLMYKNARKFVINNKENLKTYDTIIIDLRDNTGGFISDSYKIGDLFLDRGQVMGYENTRIKLFTKEIKSKSKRQLDFRRIIILENGNTASAAETFIMSLRENLPNVTVVGEKSYGKGIGQIEFRLKDGYSAQATVLTLETPDKNSIHGKGIEPDYIYTGEDIIQYALNLEL